MFMGHRILAVAVLLGIALPACGSEDPDGTPAPKADAAPQEDAGTDGPPDKPDALEWGVIRGSARLFGLENHEGIDVRVDGTTLTASTNAAGDFQLDGVPAGEVSLSASHPKYQPGRLDVAVEPGKTANVDPIVLRLGKLLRAGENCIPLSLLPSGDFALYADDFSPFLGTGSLFAHDIPKDTSIETGSGVALMGVVPSQDGRLLAAVRNVAVSSGAGELVGVDLGSGDVRSLSNAAYAGAFAFTQDSQYLIYFDNLDMSDQVGDLHIVSTTDWEDRLLATNVALGSVEEPEGQGAVWFANNVSYQSMSGDLYRWELGAADPEKVDSGVWLGTRWFGGVGQPTVYFKDYADYTTGTLAAWTPGALPRVLAHSVAVNSVRLSPDEAELLFVSDYEQASYSGKLQHWIAGPANPVAVDSNVLGDLFPSWDGSKVVYFRDFDMNTSHGTLAAWDFDASTSHDLGTSAAPWKIGNDGRRIAFFSVFDDVAQVGDLHVFDFETSTLTPVASNASSNAMGFDPTGVWLAYQLNPIADTFQGDLWLHDTSTGQNTLLAPSALPVTQWSETTQMVGYYADPDEEFVTANLWVRKLDSGETVSLGRVLFQADGLHFGPSDSWVAFHRNPSMADVTADLWVWDGAVDPWQGTNLGIEVDKKVDIWSVKLLPHGLLLMSDVSPMWGLGTVSWWSRATRQVTEFGANATPWVISEDQSQLLLVANTKDHVTGDLIHADLQTSTTESLGVAVHLQGIWLNEEWTRMVFVADTVGDVGNVVARDLAGGTSRVLGESAPFFGLSVSPDGAKLSFLHDWDGAKTIGTLSAIDLDAAAVQPIPYDDFAPFTYRMSNDHLLYVVSGDGRSGVYLAELP
jgi:hypothetical protein